MPLVKLGLPLLVSFLFILLNLEVFLPEFDAQIVRKELSFEYIILSENIQLSHIYSKLTQVLYPMKNDYKLPDWCVRGLTHAITQTMRFF